LCLERPLDFTLVRWIPFLIAAPIAASDSDLGLVAAALLGWDRPGTVYLLVDGLVYLVGTVLVTNVDHFPRNDALAAVDSTSAAAAICCADYVPAWTAGNHF
jgi:uncharacterized membrane protein